MTIKYIKHPASAEDIAAARAEGCRIIDAKFEPKAVEKPVAKEKPKQSKVKND